MFKRSDCGWYGIAAGLASLVFATPQAMAQGPAFECESAPYHISGSPSAVDTLHPEFLIASRLGHLSPALNVDGLAYNILDDYLYALVTDATVAGYQAFDIVRIAADLTVTNLGRPDPDFAPELSNGTMDSSGNFLTTSFDNLYRVNIDAGVIQTTSIIPLVKNSLWASTPKDWSFNASDGLLYGLDNHLLYSLNPANGQVDLIATSGLVLPHAAGGGWSTADGILYFYSNAAPGQLFKVDANLSPVVVSSLGNVASNTNFDATACLAPFITKGAVPKQLAAGETLSYNFALHNPLNTAIDVDFVDTLPAGLSFLAATLSPLNPGGGTVSSYTGSELIIDTVGIPPGGRVEFSVDVVVDPTIDVYTLYPDAAHIQYDGQSIKSDDPSTPSIGDDTTVSVLEPGSIGDVVWEDVNGNGVREPDERGLAGVPVSLRKKINGSFVKFQNTVTGADGTYAFAFLDAGDYAVNLSVHSDPLKNYVQTNTVYLPVLISLAADAHYGEANFGFAPSYIQVQTVARQTLVPAPDAEVSYDITVFNPSVLDVTITTLNDDRFGDLSTQGCSLPYELGSGASYSCSVTRTISGGGGEQYVNTVTALAWDRGQNTQEAQDSATVTFIDPNSAGIGQQIWRDSNGNGLFEPGEQVLANVIVELAGPVNRSTATDSTGTYHFTGLPPGDYTVTVTDGLGELQGLVLTTGNTAYATSLGLGEQDLNANFGYAKGSLSLLKELSPAVVYSPTGTVTFKITAVNDGPLDLTLTQMHDSSFGDLTAKGCSMPRALAAGASYTCTFSETVSGAADSYHFNTAEAIAEDAAGNVISDADFAAVRIIAPVDTFASIGELIWLDDNRDGVKDPGERGVDGVTVNLLQGGSVYSSDTSSIGGHYLFHVPAGDYEVEIIPGSSTLLAGLELTGGAHPRPVTVAASVVSLDIDFGYAPHPEQPSLSAYLTGSVSELLEPGPVIYSYAVDNTAKIPLTLNSLYDSVFGDLNGLGTCSLGVSIAVGATYQCEYQAQVDGVTGDVHHNTFIATVEDERLQRATSSADWRITFIADPTPPPPPPPAEPVPVLGQLGKYLLAVLLLVVAYRARRVVLG